MEVSRKGFISSVGTALVAAVALPTDRVFGGIPAPGTASRGLASEGFARQIGTSFDLTQNDGTRVPLLLSDVLKVTSRAGLEQFSLVFATGSASLPEGTYKIKHPAMAPLHMFLVPGKESRLRAEFSLLRN